MELHPEAPGLRHSLCVENLCAAPRQGGCRVEGKALEGLGVQNLAGIRSVDRIDVATDLAVLRTKGRSEDHRGGVGTPAAQGGHLAGTAHALEACHDGDLAALKGSFHTVGPHLKHRRGHMLLVRDDARLASRKGCCWNAKIGDGHGEQGHGDPFANTHEQVEFSSAWVWGHAAGQSKQLVCGVAHRGNHHNHSVPLLYGRNDARSDAANVGDIHHRRTAIFLNKNGALHAGSRVQVWRLIADDRPP